MRLTHYDESRFTRVENPKRRVMNHESTMNIVNLKVSDLKLIVQFVL